MTRQVIARQGWAAYRPGMAARLLQLLTLIALVLMPLGMASPAAAAGPAHQMEMSGCDEQSPSEAPATPADVDAQCAMACAMMLAEAPSVRQAAALRARSAGWNVASRPSGLTPEMDPPPPKRA